MKKFYNLGARSFVILLLYHMIYFRPRGLGFTFCSHVFEICYGVTFLLNKDKIKICFDTYMMYQTDLYVARDQQKKYIHFLQIRI